jgi:hypothetical protein
MRAQSAPSVSSFGRAIGLAASIILLVLLGLISPANAQEDGNQAGLVVQFADGSLRTTCVDLGPDGQATGEDMLRASGYETLIDYGSGFGGGTVCKINNEGCDFPAKKCFCECTMKPGDPCIYWSYFHLLDGQWRYSIQSLSNYVVRPGDVEAWVWGLGSAGAGVAPPSVAFEQICDPPPQATQPPSATAQLPSTSTPAPITPAVSPQPAAAATMTPEPPAEPPPVTATTEVVASIAEVEPNTPGDREESVTTLPIQDAAGASNNIASYIVFGVLVVALAGGLIFMRVR